MNTSPVLIWTVTVGLFMAIVIVRLIAGALHGRLKLHNIISTGTEREEFFVPGDPTDNEEDQPYDAD